MVRTHKCVPKPTKSFVLFCAQFGCSFCGEFQFLRFPGELHLFQQRPFSSVLVAPNPQVPSQLFVAVLPSCLFWCQCLPRRSPSFSSCNSMIRGRGGPFLHRSFVSSGASVHVFPDAKGEGVSALGSAEVDKGWRRGRRDFQRNILCVFVWSLPLFSHVWVVCCDRMPMIFACCVFVSRFVRTDFRSANVGVSLVSLLVRFEWWFGFV